MPNGHDNSLYEKLGDIQATLRVVKHDTQNLSAKVDGLGQLVIAQGHLKADVDALKAEVQTLVVEKHHRDGAIGLVGWIAQHWPFLMFALAMIIVSLWGNGKIKL